MPQAVRWLSWLAPCLLVACATREPPLAPLPEGFASQEASPRINGAVGTPGLNATPQFSYGRGAGGGPGGQGTASGNISLDFAETDIRAVVAQILGDILHVNYAIDPAVHGTATFRSVDPLTRTQLIPVLQTLLSQAGAVMQQSDGIYHVLPAATAPLAGSIVVPLHYTSADTLVHVLAPIAGNAGKLAADTGRNAVVITGTPDGEEALAELVRSFDIDLLAGQSYAVLPVPNGAPKDFVTALNDAFRAQGNGALVGLIKIVPLDQVDSVLVAAAQPRYIDQVRRVYALIQRTQRQTIRSWHAIYLQNSAAEDAAYVLQEAFTPNNVTAQPSAQSAYAAQARTTGGLNGSGSGGASGGAAGTASTGATTATPGVTTAQGTTGSTTGGATPLTAAPGTAQAATSNPLLGGLDTSGNAQAADAMRIIPNPQNNAILVYATQQEEDSVDAMVRKIDLLPLQVQIDATIAEVDLNDALQYGTQFFFKSGGINGILSTANQSLQTSNLTAAAFGTSLPGFVIGCNGLSGAPLAISALQAVTKVRVLSSPELMVLDNQPAKLQVGDLVPYLTGSATSVLTADAPVVNSVNYRETGVILQVTPRVSSTGLVTLDVSQEVSAVDTAAPQTAGLNSPTFSDRNIISRVVVQDGQTVGLAGLIQDSDSRGNSGIPWLKDIPLLGALAGTQNNNRTRQELLVLITPHVIHNQNDVRAFAESMRAQFGNAAQVPQALQTLGASGSEDPNRPLRRRLGTQ